MSAAAPERRDGRATRPALTTNAWPCGTCGQPGFRNLGVDGFCLTHYAELIRRFDPSVFTTGGIGLPGRTNNDEDLECVRCGATWVGAPAEPCRWCARSLEIQRQHAAELVLVPPASRRPAALEAWAERLERAVAAGLLTADRAETAVRREVARAVS